MNPLSNRTYLLIFVALAFPAVLSLWMLTVPGLMSTSTYAAVTALLISVMAVTLNSARNAGPTGSLGQLLYETDHPVRPVTTSTATRSNPW
jgi:hypothetical protein